jgi:hypothetical protein
MWRREEVLCSFLGYLDCGFILHSSVPQTSAGTVLWYRPLLLRSTYRSGQLPCWENQVRICEKCPLLFSDFKENWTVLTNFRNPPREVTWLRRLVAGLSQQSPGITSESAQIGFVVGTGFCPISYVSPVSIIPPWLSILLCYLGGEQQASWWPQFGDIVSTSTAWTTRTPSNVKI